jgi:hypothetical protein
MGAEQPGIQHRQPLLAPAAPEPAEMWQTQTIPDPGHRFLLLPTGQEQVYDLQK